VDPSQNATYSTGSEWVIGGGTVLGPVIDIPQEQLRIHVWAGGCGSAARPDVPVPTGVGRAEFRR
jgi:hypothetical protein